MLYLGIIKEQVDPLKEKAKDKKLLIQMLGVLKEYHIVNDEEKFEIGHRRKAICVGRPYPYASLIFPELIKFF